MEREAIALRLGIEAVLAIARGRGLRRLSPTTRYEGRQPIDIAILAAALWLMMLRLAAAMGMLFPWGEELRIARQIGLRVAGAERHLLAGLGRALLVAVVGHVIAHVDSGFGAEERRGLPELLLRCGDQAEIMLGVLVVILRRHRIARRLRIARELNVFLGDMRRCAADFDIRSVRFVDPGERIVAFAVS